MLETIGQDKMNIEIRDAQLSDAERLLEIYAPYVQNTAISFEYDVPTVEEFRQRIAKVKEKFFYLTAVENGKIVGYIYASTFRVRRAYDHCIETSIYIDRAYRRRGIGQMLYAELENRLRGIGIRNMYACVTYTAIEDEYLTQDSFRFHGKMGFVECGHFHKCGYKFGHWYDLVVMEKFLDE